MIEYKVSLKKYQLPFFLHSVKAGFPSPADDFIDKPLNLDDHLIKHPSSTFFVRVSGDSMVNVGIFPEDILVVVRSLVAKSNSIVICVLDGDMTVKRLVNIKNEFWLYPENNAYKPIRIKEDNDFSIWGVVTSSIHKFYE